MIAKSIWKYWLSLRQKSRSIVHQFINISNYFLLVILFYFFSKQLPELETIQKYQNDLQELSEAINEYVKPTYDVNLFDYFKKIEKKIYIFMPS